MKARTSRVDSNASHSRERGLPTAIRSDNGVPFASAHSLFNLSKLSIWWLRQEFNHERPHEALAMKCPVDLYVPASRQYHGLPELEYPLHDREAVVTHCGRLCLHRKKISISRVFSGQKLGIREVDDAVWLVSFMHYDLGYVDLEEEPCNR